MTTTLVTYLLLFATRPGFDDFKAEAANLESVAKAIETLVGVCKGEDPEHRIRCQENIRSESRQLRDKQFYLDLGAGHQQLLEFEGTHGSDARFLWVPMYDPGHGMPISLKRPGSLTAEGWPVLKKMVLDGSKPADQSAGDLRRLARLGQVNIEIIGRFGDSWSLHRKGKEAQGVVFKADAIRLSQARTGEKIIDVVIRKR